MTQLNTLISRDRQSSFRSTERMPVRRNFDYICLLSLLTALLTSLLSCDLGLFIRSKFDKKCKWPQISSYRHEGRNLNGLGFTLCSLMLDHTHPKCCCQVVHKYFVMHRIFLKMFYNMNSIDIFDNFVFLKKSFLKHFLFLNNA